jgi:hypothetical protein
MAWRVCSLKFKSDGPPGFLLSDGCAIRRVPAGGDILDPDGRDITPSKLTVDCQIEHGKVASAALDLEFCPDRPDVFESQRRLRPGQLVFVPRRWLGRGGSIHLILHGHTPQLGYRSEKHEPPGQALESGPFSGQCRLRGRPSGKGPVAIDPKAASAESSAADMMPMTTDLD